MRSALIIFFCSLSFYSMAQKELQLKARVKMTATAKNIVNAFVTSDDELIRVFKQDLGIRKIETGQYAGMNYKEIQEGVVFQDGREISFKKHELIQSVINGRIMTITSDNSSNKQKVILYEVENSRLVEKAAKDFDSTENQIWQTDNNVISNDLIEGYGTFLEIFNPELKSLNIYSPFEKGYSEVLVGSFNSNVVAVFEGLDKEIKAVIFNSYTGKVINEGFLEPNIFLQKINVLENEFIIYSASRLYCYSFSGTRLWEKDDFVAPNLDVFNSGNALYFLSKDKLFSIDSKSGLTKWQKKLTELIDGSGVDNKTRFIRATFFDASNTDNITFGLGVAQAGILSLNQATTRTKLVQLEDNGNKILEYHLSEGQKLLGIMKESGAIRAFTNSEILRYEK